MRANLSGLSGLACIGGGLLWAHAAHARDVDACALPPPPGDPGSLELSWQRDDGGNLGPVLLVRVPDREGLRVRVDARVWFAGLSWTWSSDTVEAAAYETIAVELSTLEEARFHGDQADWLSDLVVQVALLGEDGTELLRQGAPSLHLAWEEAEPLLLDHQEALTRSVQGAWSAAARAEVEAVRSVDEEAYETWNGRLNP